MDQAQKPSHRLLFIGIAVVAIILAIVSVAIYTLVGTPKKESAVTTQAAQTAALKVPTKDQVKQNLATLDASLKQSSADQASAKAALADGQNQVKVSN